MEVTLLEQHRPGSGVERLEIEGRVLERRTRGGEEAHVVLVEKGPLVDTRPDGRLAHEDTRVVHGVENLAIASTDGEVFYQGILGRILTGDMGAVVGADDIQVVLFRRLVELLKHIDDGKVIGLDNAYVLSAGNVDALVHGVAVAAVGLVNDHDTLVAALIFVDDRERRVR